MVSNFNALKLLRCANLRGHDFTPLFALLLALISSPVFAAAGDVISNTASIDFVYLGNALTQESSPFGNSLPGIGNGTPTTFTEDRLINFSVVSADATAVAVAALQTSAVLSFTVTNNGNAPQDFLLTAINTSPSPFVANTDNFDPLTPMQVFVEDGASAGYLSSEDTQVFIDELAAGASATVYLVANIPATSIGDAAAIALVAQIAEGGAAGQGAVISSDDNGHISPAGTFSNGVVSVAAGTANPTADTVALETVFNDPSAASPEDVSSDGIEDVRANGQHSDTAVFLVQTAASANVELNKTVTVIDTLGGTDPHAGATLRYQIDVVISGVTNISNLVITDPIPASTTYTPATLSLNGAAQTDTGDAPTDFSEFDGSRIIVDLSQGGTVSIAPATPNQIIFDVTIN